MIYVVAGPSRYSHRSMEGQRTGRAGGCYSGWIEGYSVVAVVPQSHLTWTRLARLLRSWTTKLHWSVWLSAPPVKCHFQYRSYMCVLCTREHPEEGQGALPHGFSTYFTKIILTFKNEWLGCFFIKSIVKITSTFLKHAVTLKLLAVLLLLFG